jgi:hypothetical protein
MLDELKTKDGRDFDVAYVRTPSRWSSPMPKPRQPGPKEVGGEDPSAPQATSRDGADAQIADAPAYPMRWLFTNLLAVAALMSAGNFARAEILISIDTAAQRMTVTVDGMKRWTWPVSTGQPGYLTPKGTYTAFRMERHYFSKEWDYAPMPHSIFFTKRGHAIHGSHETKQLGTPVSHGCVRLNPANAAKLYRLVESRGMSSATVVVDANAHPRTGR